MPQTTPTGALQATPDIAHAADLRVLQLIASSAPLPEVLDALVRSIETRADGMLGSILLLEDGKRVRHGAAPNLPRAFIDAIDGEPIGPAAGSCGTAAYRKERVIVTDIATDPLWARYRDGALAFGLRACWSEPILDKDGRVLGTFALYYTAPRKPTEMQLSLVEYAGRMAAIAIEKYQRDAELWRSQQQLGLIYEHTEDVLFQLRVEDDGGFRFESVNPAFLRATGLGSSQVVGKRVEKVIPEPSLTTVLAHYAEAVRTGTTQRWDETTTFPAGTRHGEIVVTPVHDANGKPTHLVGAVRDMTERRQLEDELRQLQKMEAISRLSGGIAHDFNNLLSVILMSGTALHDELVDADQRSLLQEILEAGGRGAELTRRILTVSRKQPLQPEPLILNDVVKGLDAMLRRLLGSAITFHTSLAADLWTIEADKSGIEQVILNLIVNARDAMPDGGGITIATRNIEMDEAAARAHIDVQPGQYACLTVTDTGLGMDAGTLSHIFEPFFTTKPDDRGTGLGLATVYGIVKQSGGIIRVTSAPDQGSTFRIFLPRAANAPLPPPKREHRRSSGHISVGHVLVVEDEPALRAMFARLLPQLRCRVTVAASGEDALRLVRDGGLDPNIVITDLNLPGMSGAQLGEELRLLPEAPKVIYISGFPERADEARYAIPKGAPFLHKPFTITELGAVIEDVLLSETRPKGPQA